jgi:hypothetical protein
MPAGRSSARCQPSVSDLFQTSIKRHVLVDAQTVKDLAHIGGLLLGLGMADVAHMQDQIGGQHLFQRGAEGRDQLMGQIR